MKEKIVSENSASWDDYLCFIYQKNNKISKIIICLTVLLLISSSAGLYSLLPTDRVSVYSMEINDDDNGNFLIKKGANIPRSSFDFDEYLNTSNSDK